VIGIGVDLVDVERIRVALARTPSLRDRLFTADEQAYAASAKDPAERFAVRFAAKEAAMKALGVGIGAIGWHDVEVVRAESGEPSLSVTGRAAELAAERGVTSWLLTLTHTATVAEAIAVAR
jgi:holo-[acyl-carrier protein] synthase